MRNEGCPEWSERGWEGCVGGNWMRKKRETLISHLEKQGFGCFFSVSERARLNYLPLLSSHTAFARGLTIQRSKCRLNATFFMSFLWFTRSLSKPGMHPSSVFHVVCLSRSYLLSVYGGVLPTHKGLVQCFPPRDLTFACHQPDCPSCQRTMLCSSYFEAHVFPGFKITWSLMLKHHPLQ